MGSKIATCGDVYSFGILLLEMFTGKTHTDPMFSDGLNLHNFVKMDLPHRVAEIADSLFDPITPDQSSIMSAEKIQVCLSSIFKIGISCSDESPRDRKDMSDVVTELHSIRDLVLGQKLL
ncbi:putative receptor-like protein kinase At3g47110 [Pyrus communis]|uniref:putative receptor-like protein kinase At3g47110 n=1 Tax=Pyrus communis TaxID=23211 RepID=UPI0035C25BDF